MKIMSNAGVLSVAILLSISILLFPPIVSAAKKSETEYTSQGVLDKTIEKYAKETAKWEESIKEAAAWLFWTLVIISMVWTFGMLALRQADLAEFFGEFIRFIIFTGFYWWLLENGPDMAGAIIQGLTKVSDMAVGNDGSLASIATDKITPSSIVDIGFLIYGQAISNMNRWKIWQSLMGTLLSGGIMVILAIVAINLLLLSVSAWILAYAGIFLLGFGGSRWTSDMAINYFKTVLSIGVQLMVMSLIVGIGLEVLLQYYDDMTHDTIIFEEMAVMLVFCLTLFMVASKVPSMVSGIVTGAGIGNVGISGSASSVVAAGAMALGGVGLAASGASALGLGGGSQKEDPVAAAIKAGFDKLSGSEGGDDGGSSGGDDGGSSGGDDGGSSGGGGGSSGGDDDGDDGGDSGGGGGGGSSGGGGGALGGFWDGDIGWASDPPEGYGEEY